VNRVLRRLAALVVGAGLVFGVAPLAGAATDGSTGARTASSAQCAQLRRRLSGAPATLRRVDANLEELRTRLAGARLPARRAALEQRIQRLQQLRAALTTRVADARAACRTTT
jgi:hypothetical protein